MHRRVNQQKYENNLTNRSTHFLGATSPIKTKSWPADQQNLCPIRSHLPGTVVVEVPAKQQWCEIRTTVFSWTPTRFPFHPGSAKKLTFGQSPIITVIGKAFWDVGHAPKDQSNRRKYMPDYAVWEIHPVMKLTVQPTA